MGQKKFVTIDLSQEQEQEYKPEADVSKVASEAKTESGEKKKAVKPILSESGKDISHLMDDDTSSEAEEVRPLKKKGTKRSELKKKETPEEETGLQKTKKSQKSRSRRYKDARALVDRTKNYPLSEAVKLIKKTSISRFDGSVEAHAIVTETGLKAEIQFPHATGRTTKVAIADDKVLEDIAAGKVDFDVLLATPAIMPKLAKLAKILGPKGLMPSPKSGTITPDPKKKKLEMEGGKTLVRTEPKAPLIHVVVGKVSLSETELTANVQALVNGLTPRNFLKLTLSSTMGPGIKVDLSEFKA